MPLSIESVLTGVSVMSEAVSQIGYWLFYAIGASAIALFVGAALNLGNRK